MTWRSNSLSLLVLHSWEGTGDDHENHLIIPPQLLTLLFSSRLLERLHLTHTSRSSQPSVTADRKARLPARRTVYTGGLRQDGKFSGAMTLGACIPYTSCFECVCLCAASRVVMGPKPC